MDFTQEQIANFRLVHTALTARATDNDVAAWAEEIGVDAFERIMAEECETLGVDYDQFNAWAKDMDADTEIMENMGAFLPDEEPTPGPWDVMTFSATDNPNVASVTTRTGIVVANMPRHVAANPYGIAAKNAEANAKLIAASPDGNRVLAFLAKFIEQRAPSVSFSALMPDSETETIGEAIAAYCAKVC